MKNPDMVDAAKLKTYMHDMVMVTLANRLNSISKELGLGPLSELSDEQIAAIADTSMLQWVRCAVVQRDDGYICGVVDAKSIVDKAIPDAEISALAGLKSKLGDQGVRQCWTMEIDFANAALGTLHTCSKAAVERLIKKPSIITGKVDFGFIPFDNQQLDAKKAAEQQIQRTGQQLSPGYYTGKTRLPVPAHTHGPGPGGP